MLILVNKLRDLRFSQLMAVYQEGNEENGREFWPEHSAGEQLLRAETEFYRYLREVFFPTPGAVYALWAQKDQYVSALRLEPFGDGLLLEALETHPDHRRKGYARELILAVAEAFPGNRIYSHIGKKNLASLGVHESCGFRRIAQQARYIDGSVDSRCCTMLLET